MTDHDRFRLDDAAYAMGALDPAEHAAYEHHLAECPTCRDAQRQLASTLTLLALADPGAAEVAGLSPAADEPAPATILPGLVRRTRARRRRTLMTATAVAAVAACLVTILATIAVVSLRTSSARPAVLSLAPLTASAANVQATVSLTADGHGTRLRVHCGHYAASAAGYPSNPGDYRLVLVDAAGAVQYPLTWAAGPDVDLTTSSDWSPAMIRRVVIEDARHDPILQLVL